tara:strand:+ start:16931 stop:17461 length:531 start_codon:yes stop_codon:yes gene_type:complete
MTIIRNEFIEYPPSSTGQNLSQTQVATLSDNVTTSSPDQTTINLFSIAIHDNNLVFPNSIYDTGNISLDPSEIKLTNTSGKPFSFTVEFSGLLTSSSTINNGRLGIRLNSTGGLGTGTEQIYPSGITIGSTTISNGFNTKGAFTLLPGESCWLEVVKSVIGTLIVTSSLIIIKPIF